MEHLSFWRALLLLMILYQANAYAMSSLTKRFLCSGHSCIVKLRPSQWDHILLGEKFGRKRGSGAHCAAHFDLRKAPYIFFDLSSNAYVIPKAKDIDIEKFSAQLKHGDIFQIRSLFPPGVLSKEFVLESFIKAKLEGGIYEQVFHTELENFKVAGQYSIKSSGEFDIRTFFPDVNWRKRVMMEENEAESLCANFLIWNPKKKSWERFLECVDIRDIEFTEASSGFPGMPEPLDVVD